MNLFELSNNCFIFVVKLLKSRINTALGHYRAFVDFLRCSANYKIRAIFLRKKLKKREINKIIITKQN